MNHFSFGVIIPYWRSTSHPGFYYALTKDIDHTMDYIEKTKKGEMKKHEPLSVIERGDGTYSIIDGNRSYSALKELGAKSIPQNRTDRF